MEFPNNLLYSKTHEWVSIEGGEATIGISDHAQDALGDIVMIELPKKGEDVEQDEAFGAIESVKARSELISPVGGKVIEINDQLTDSPELINEDCYGDGWLLKVKISGKPDLDDLMSAKEYEKFLKESEE